MSAPLGRSAAGRRGFARLVAARHPLLFLDLDGTLAPLGENPELASVPRRTRRILDRLRKAGVKLVLVSGRSAKAAARILGTRSDAIIGDHGARLMVQGRITPFLPADRNRLRRAARHVERLIERRRGIWLERKDRSLAIHVRLPAGHQAQIVRRVRRLLLREGLRVLEGHQVLDAQLPGVNKGRAVRRWLQRHHADALLYAGDDTTDRDAFRALGRTGLTIAVGPRVHGAATRTRDPGTLAAWLGRLASAREARR